MTAGFSPKAISAIETFPSSEIRRGMTGTGYSVFAGTRPEPFKVIFIGVMEKAASGQDIILARLEGANLELTGVSQGMSGSPVYIDGKLVGAISYAWSFGKEPIAGITPIADMLPLWDTMESGIHHTATPALPSRRSPYSADSPSPLPIKTPLYISGMSPAAIDYLSDKLSPYNITPILGGGSSSSEEGIDDLAPGSVIGALLFSGDFEAAAIGTVTARDGDRILAFGHPFFGLGNISLPMTGGYVHTVLASTMISFKMASPGQPLGTVRTDLLPGIAGSVGTAPDMFPMSVSVSDPELGRSKTFKINVARLPKLTPAIVVSVISEAAANITGGAGNMMVTAVTEATFDGIDTPYHTEDTMFSPGGFYPYESVGGLVTLLTNPYREIDLKTLSISLTVRHTRDTYEVMSALPAAATYKPGDTVTAKVTLRKFNGGDVTRDISLKLPTDIPLGPAQIVIDGGASTTIPATLAPPSDFEGLLDRLLQKTPGNSIVAYISYPEKAFGIAGTDVLHLPSTMQDTMLRNTLPDTAVFDNYQRVVFPSDTVTYGRTIIRINIDKERNQ